LAEIVSSYAVPHTPSFIAEQDGHAPCTGAIEYFGKVAAHLAASRPDVLVMIQNDHFNTFFLDNWPTFAIGLASNASGPSDQTPDMPRYRLSIETDLAHHIHKGCVHAEFDLSSSQELSLDHAVLVPLHFMTPLMRLPIVPIYVNCLVSPLPSATRCYLLGAAKGPL
jgi:protocatechuate 4,5-dioxygenase beta chain